MKIVGLDSLIFGVDDVRNTARFLADYGLTPVDVSDAGAKRKEDRHAALFCHNWLDWVSSKLMSFGRTQEGYWPSVQPRTG